MIHFDENYFQKINFDKEYPSQVFNSALRNLEIARKSNIPEVIFKFSYDALIKLGITLIAKQGFRVKSVTGHHVKILSALSELLGNHDIEVMGNHMRQKRNLDLYEADIEVTEKECKEYLCFIETIQEKVRHLI